MGMVLNLMFRSAKILMGVINLGCKGFEDAKGCGCSHGDNLK